MRGVAKGDDGDGARPGGRPGGRPAPSGRAAGARSDFCVARRSGEDVCLPLRPPFSLGALYLTYLEEHYGFSGLLRPRAEQDTFTIFDLAVAYPLDDRARMINERRPAGTQVRYPR